MKKNSKVITTFILVFVITFVAFVLLFNDNKQKNLDNTSDSKQIVNENTLSMMIEQTAGAGDYKMETRTSYPTDGYMFNATLSKCENGGELGWDETKGVVTMTGNMSDKCYIYFDKVLTLASYIKSLYTGVQGENSIYYHNSSLTNGAGDNSYRYAGASSTVNNYICFGSDTETCPTDNLYRIIGVFGDQVKLIKATVATSALLGTNGAYDSDTSYMWSTLTGCPDSSTGYLNDNSNSVLLLSNKKDILGATGGPENNACSIWKYSDLNTINLNENFITNIGYEWISKIAITTWKVGGNTEKNIVYVVPSTAYQNEIVNPDFNTTYDAKIGLMYVSDYYYAASPTYWTYVGYNSSDSTKDYRAASTSNWMYLGSFEWTLTSLSNFNDYVFSVASSGTLTYDLANYSLSVRPVFYLESSATYSSGGGTSSNSYRIN